MCILRKYPSLHLYTQSSAPAGDGDVSETPGTDEPLTTGALSADEIRELVAREVVRVTAELRDQVVKVTAELRDQVVRNTELRSTIQALEARVAALENQQ